MQKILITCMLILALLCCNVECVNASQKTTEKLELVFLQFEKSDYVCVKIPILLMSDFSEEQKAYMLFTNLFQKPKNLLSAIPAQTQIISVELNEGSLVLEVSEEILNYAGGQTEGLLIEQIIQTASCLNVRYVTLNISGELAILPEGSIIYMEDLNAKN